MKEALIEADPSRCWDAVRDFAAVANRLVPGFVTEAEMLGPRERRVTFFSGAVAHEYLVGIDDENMRLAYTVTESPMGSSHHNASVQIVPEGTDRCRIVWITDVLPDDLGERSELMMSKGLEVIRQTLEATA